MLNLIGGEPTNSVTPGVRSAVIAGGGWFGGQENKVTDDGGFVGGGWWNQAGDNVGTVGDAGAAVGAGATRT